jgi:prepilin-type N-terminal cleavage/methylation domain-containing protein
MNRRKYSLLRKPHRQHRSASGFTIVELLVVIVVIGILAAITIVSYTGISQKAVLASLQSDLSTSAQKLKMYQVEHSAYPAALDDSNCPKDSTGAVDALYCLKPSPGNRFVYGSSSPYSTFSLTATNDNGISYQVTDNSQPTALVPAPLSPVADWLATAQGDHYGNYYDLVNHGWATVTRSTPKTIYDPNDGRIHDVPANYLAMDPWSAYQAGGRGSAAVIEEARTNYLVNSYGAASTNGAWNSWALRDTSAATPIQTLAAGVYGSTAQRIQLTADASDSAKTMTFAGTTAIGTFAATENATGSVWVKAALSGTQFRVKILAMDDALSSLGVVQSALVSSTDTFTRVSVTYSNLPTGTTRCTLYLQFTGAISAGVTIDLTLDAAQLEKGAFATSYIPTTTTAVTRNADVVTVPTTGWNAAAGTIVVVANIVTKATYQYLFALGTSGANRLRSFYSNTGKVGNNITASGTTVNCNHSSVSAALAVNTTSWENGDSLSLYQNGSLLVSSPGVVSLASLPATANIGSYIDNSAFTQDPIQRVTIYPTALSSSDVSTVTNAVKDGP